ncbi:hypothetical protein H5970_04935 [Amycolatopsis sp. CM201R]|uniref:hypothetical protein n=1 Tax=Amycolatopsis sp. 505 TaxID=2761538 RepID=UPI0028762D04|nr:MULTISPECIES: hypothetical protein [unclassified Amycolatopsis]MDS0137535.1 hypothetical protein [Amycolatopsis sp. 505]MDS0141730.1 hypothetical protein [Amycolatopsis sp. CM201R]
MAVPEAVAGLAAIPGLRTAAQLGEPNPDASAPAGSLPLAPALTKLVPGGLRRGSAVSVTGSTALVFALLAEAIGEGSWAAITGMPEAGLVAAAELGVALDRLALFPHPGAEVAAVLSALIDGFDLVVLGPPVTRGMQPQLARRLAGRVRNRGAVLLAAGPWPSADLDLRVSNRRWRGLTDDGFGHLEFREVVATSRGRGAAAQPRTVALQLPGPGGAVAVEVSAGRGLTEVAG